MKVNDDLAAVFVSTFGHCFGASTPGADLVLNARKVQNPGSWAKGSTGMNKKVRQAVLMDAKATRLVVQGVQVVKQINEGDSFHIAVGCERGRHWSVSIAIEIAARLEAEGLYNVQVIHRDMDRARCKRKKRQRPRDRGQTRSMNINETASEQQNEE